jgi:hypothetical protein
MLEYPKYLEELVVESRLGECIMAGKRDTSARSIRKLTDSWSSYW